MTSLGLCPKRQVHLRCRGCCCCVGVGGLHGSTSAVPKIYNPSCRRLLWRSNRPASTSQALPRRNHCAASAVPPQDVVHEDLTVRENLVYSARLRLSAGKPVREQLALVEDCIDLLQVGRVGWGCCEGAR